MNSIAIGLHNLARNLRRSLTTTLSIAFGFAAVTLFSGYTADVYEGLARQAIHGELLGHLTLARPGMQQEGKLHPERYLLTGEEIARIRQIVQATVPEAMLAPRLSLSGLVSNGRISTIFLAEGLDPADMQRLRGHLAGSGGDLDTKATEGIGIARGLATLLGLKAGNDVSLLVSTLHGQANVSDANVLDTYSTGNAGLEDKALFMPLALARTLYDVPERADRLTLLLPDNLPTPARLAKTRQQLAQAFAEARLPIAISTWQEDSAFYRQVKGMFDMIFGFILAIVLTIVVMSVTNAMSMSVVERTREIGTLRAIGLKRAGVVRLFVTEALLLIAIGCITGLLLALLVRAGVNHADISYQPPNSSGRIPLHIGLDLGRIGFTLALLGLLGVVAAWFPARRAARLPIIDALAHV